MIILGNYLSDSNIGIFDSTDKIESIDNMIKLITDNKEFNVSSDTVREQILERENIMSTGIGRGIAVPHIRLDNIENVFMSIGIFQNKIDFGSIDDAPVQIIVMLIVPRSMHKEYLRILSKLVLLLKNEKLKSSLLSSQTNQQIYDILRKY